MKQPSLKPLHPDSSLNTVKLEEFQKRSNEELLGTLLPGQTCSLTTRPDGTLMEGHHRLKILRERGVDVDELPREIVPKNSELMITYPIEGPWPGKLAIVPRPRGGEWLDDELRGLKDAGFETLVSLLTKSESEELGLVGEADISRAHGIGFLTFPIIDLSVPDSLEAAEEFLDTLHRALLAGKKIAIHCRQGIGRSGLIASSLLVLSGVDPTSAFRKVSAARGFPAPETSEQRDWVFELAHSRAEPVVLT